MSRRESPPGGGAWVEEQIASDARLISAKLAELSDRLRPLSLLLSSEMQGRGQERELHARARSEIKKFRMFFFYEPRKRRSTSALPPVVIPLIGPRGTILK